MMNLNKSVFSFAVALLSVVFFIGEVDARRLSGGALGGGGFSRAGIASGGGFSARSSAARAPQRATSRQASTIDRQGSRQDLRSGRQENAGDRQGNRQDNAGNRQDGREGNREDRQEAIRDRQDNRQDFIEDGLDDDWDGRWDDNDGEFLAGAIVGGAIVAASRPVYYGHTTVYTTLPCSISPVNFESIAYYNCSGVWYKRVYSGGNVSYVATMPPPGY
jgi:hypothetical protein